MERLGYKEIQHVQHFKLEYKSIGARSMISNSLHAKRLSSRDPQVRLRASIWLDDTSWSLHMYSTILHELYAA